MIALVKGVKRDLLAMIQPSHLKTVSEERLETCHDVSIKINTGHIHMKSDNIYVMNFLFQS